MPTLHNLAIIAHVDHGKTTLIDALLAQSGTFAAHQAVEQRVMDSHDLEKERGITILAKCTAIEWEEHRINIIDTPGHADFGGEVERVLSMVDGAILLVDAAEGPMPQTKFVLSKALQQGLKPIVVINKIDRADARASEVIDEVFDLFVALEANDEQLDFPILYAAGRDGWCVRQLEDPRENLRPLLACITKQVTPPQVDADAPFAMLATLLESDPYLGRVLTGRVAQGQATLNMPVKALNLAGEVVETARLTKLLTFRGVERCPVETATAGDIIAIAGLTQASVADTICASSVGTPLPSTAIDPPTMAITISVNDSPLAGQSGDKLTSRVLRARLLAEAESNVAITVTESDEKDAFAVGGRGELQLGVLLETMRREGFELSVSRPRVLYKEDPESGAILEPIEEVVIDVDEPYTGIVIEKLSARNGDMQDMRPSGGGKTRLTFHVPSQGLIGYQRDFLTDTRGTGIMSRLFHHYAPKRPLAARSRNGVLIATDPGNAVAYALFNLQNRGILFIDPKDPVYTGMIVGEHSRDNDLEVNVLKGKQLTNIRASGSDEAVRLTPPRKLSLEMMMSYLEEDERLEITPTALRLRKTLLNPHDRKRAKRTKT